MKMRGQKSKFLVEALICYNISGKTSEMKMYCCSYQKLVQYSDNFRPSAYVSPKRITLFQKGSLYRSYKSTYIVPRCPFKFSA